MKIAVMTYWDSMDNYGQILQGFALQKHLCSLGHEAFIIRFHEERPKETVRHKIRKFSPAYLMQYISYRKNAIVCKNFNTIYNRNFRDFKERQIRYSEKEYYSFNDLLCEDWSDVDAFICGSDQIWSPKSKQNMLAYMLAFVPLKSKKIAYACSFGRESIDARQKGILSGQLKTFDGVSVREKTGLKICKGVDCKNANLVCDPTILLKQNDYSDLLNIRQPSSEHTLFLYLLNWSMQFPLSGIEDLMRNRGLVPNYFPTNGTNKGRFPVAKDLSIEKWIEGIASAEIVVSNSFHGTVFSILFHRPFVALSLQGKDSGMNDRLKTLLTQLGLEDRIWDGTQTIESISRRQIDWTKVDECIRELRETGIDFLRKGLSNTAHLPEHKHNICFYTHYSIHHDYGGLDRVTELLAGYFERKGNKVFFLSQKRRKSIHEDKQYFLPNADNLRSRENVDEMERFIKEHHIDVLVNQEGNVDITLPIKSQVEKITVLHFNPNYISDGHFENKFSRFGGTPEKIMGLIFRIPLIKRMGLASLRRKLSTNYRNQILWSDKFVLLSDRFKPELRSLVGRDFDMSNVTAINNPLSYDDPIDVDGLLDRKENLIVYVGRLDNNFKRIDLQLNAWKIISSQRKDWSFKIIGDGPDRDYLQQYVKEEGILNVRFEGRQDPADYYKRAKIILLSSSSSEGWGMVLVEAQHYGCVPVAMKSYSSLPDIIEDGGNGLIVNNDDFDTFSMSIAVLMDDADRLNGMARNAIRMSERFSIDKIGAQWIRLMN